ncbi:hypothetical protein ACTXJJ_06355 [Corynebacterium casei]|uniref:hypothetical protein n=1 Tax=Corynebacterium casei TaxID=160386 RepID=UPI003FBA5FE5
MRNPILSTLAFIVTLVLVDITLSDPVGLPRWLSLIIALVLAVLAAWGVHKLLDDPIQRSTRQAKRWEAEHRARQAWKAKQRADFEAERRKPHPEMPADPPPAPAQDQDFETRELPAVPEPGRSPNRVDRAVDRATSLETPADRDVRKAAESPNRVERFFD